MHAESRGASASTPSALVIAAQTKPGSPLSEVTDAVRAALEKLDAVRLLPASPLDLDAVQLAIDCPDESARCLREIATRMEAEIVIVPALKRRNDALELRLTCFKQDARKAPTTAMRKQAGTKLDATLLEAVPSMLREVLEIGDAPVEEAPQAEPVAEPEEPETTTPIEEQPAATEATSESSFKLPLGPVLLGGGGVALIVAGVVVGIVASSTEDEYASRVIDTEQQAKAADVLRVNGENQALTANLLLGTGAAALVAAGIWYVLDGQTEHATAHASLRPVLGPRSAGLVLAGRWELLP